MTSAARSLGEILDLFPMPRFDGGKAPTGLLAQPACPPTWDAPPAAPHRSLPRSSAPSASSSACRRRQSIAQMQVGDSRGGDSSGGRLLSREGCRKEPLGEIQQAWASSGSLSSETMDDQTSEASTVTTCDVTRTMSIPPMCSDDDAHGDDVIEGASTESMTTAMTMYTDSNNACRKDKHVAQPNDASESVDNDRPLPGKALMIRNIPCRVRHDELVRVINELGFGGRCDQVYLPLSYRHRPANIGYAFLRLLDEADEEAFKLAFDGFRFPGTTSQKVCRVQPARLQGSEFQLAQHRRKGRRRLRREQQLA